ncbi:DoxX family protein [Paraflavitalea soli]|uniref:DoxX family protein n=1 Tax=Paraflavitalea soli TaxID=2315862 RepID=A0A3B7MWC1_9BACT|nr:DoxX family protein [Paraflavitalea soli]AXY77743.1 DoxX family protein [Paraflavitalea soli]
MNSKKIRREKIIYWTATGIIGAVMTFSIISFTFFDGYTYPEGAFTHLHLPAYFKAELTIAKVLGVLILLLPGIPGKIKEYAYVGFGITLVSAIIAHAAVGDGIMYIIDPLLFLGVLILSYIYFTRLQGYKHSIGSNIEVLLSK